MKAFEEEGVKFDILSGTSSGSIVATLYACGYGPDEIYTIFQKYGKQIGSPSPWHIFKLVFELLFRRGFCLMGFQSGEKIECLMNKMCKKKGVQEIQEIKIPLIIPSVDIDTGKIYAFLSKSIRGNLSDEVVTKNQGNIGRIVRASCSYPVMFEPVMFENVMLVDGGLRENVPWKLAKKIGADKVISIIFEDDSSYRGECVVDIIEKSIGILSHELANYELEGADFVIKLETKEKIRLLDMSHFEELYDLGYRTVKKRLKDESWKRGIIS